MYNDLPEFRKTKYSYAMTYINGVLSGTGGASLIRLEEFDDHHFRVIFDLNYFQLADGAEMPSKSQWNTLKKKMKRRNRSIFVFREYGAINCPENVKNSEQVCLYIDFGFMYG